MLLPVEVPELFSLSSVIQSHGWAILAPFETDEDRTELGYVLRLGTGRVAAIRLRQDGSTVHIEVDGILKAGEVEELKEVVTWMLGLEQDFSEFYDRVRDHTKLSHVIDKGGGRILRSATLFEDTVKTILTTNTSWGGTVRMVGSLVSEYGDPLPGDPARRAFPRPDRLGKLGEDDLRAAGLGYRAPYVRGLAADVAAGEMDLERFKTSDLPTDELRSQLLAITGVGEYAAANLLMLLGRYDYLPVDSWARKMVSEEWHEAKSIGKEEVLDAFDRWGKWKGLAYWFWDWSSNSPN